MLSHPAILPKMHPFFAIRREICRIRLFLHNHPSISYLLSLCDVLSYPWKAKALALVRGRKGETMNTFVSYAYAAARLLLRSTTVLILCILLYTCLYIYLNAPDGGAMRDFKQTVAQLLGHAIACLSLTFLAAAIPEVRVI